MKEDIQVKALISAMLDEDLSEAQAKELDQILQQSAEARDIYRRMVDMHFTLGEISESKDVLAFNDLPEPESFPETFRTTRKQLLIFKALAACLAVAFGVSLFNTKEVIKNVEVVKNIEVIKNLPKKIPLASISDLSSDAQWSTTPKQLGDMVYNEEIILTRGQVTLTYNHGAEIKLEGPVHYKLINLDLANLAYGQLAAKVPEAAQGFTVEAPKAAIVDLGTEFALNVDKAGKSQIYVYDGEVSSSLLGPDGNSLLNASLYENDGLVIDSENETVNKLNGNVDFIRVNTKRSNELLISSDYIEAVKSDNPVAYWRFENSTDGLVKNEMSSSYTGELMQEAKTENNTLSLTKGKIGAFFVKEAFHGINKDGYTIELWLNAMERGTDMSLASLMPPEPEKRKFRHLAYTQLMAKQTSLRHKPFDFRFSHRYPATSSLGKNIFADEAYVPGKWYHFVAVKDKNSFKLYLNGQLKQSLADKANNDALPYLFYLGKIDPIRDMRQFIGQLDEVALYNKALSPEEINEHFSKAQIKGKR